MRTKEEFFQMGKWLDKEKFTDEKLEQMWVELEAQRAQKRAKEKESGSSQGTKPETNMEPVVYFFVDFKDGRAPVRKDTLQSAKEYGEKRAALDHTHEDVMIVDDIGDPVSIRYWHYWDDCIDYAPDYDPEKDGNKNPIEFDDGWYDDWLDLDE